MGAIWQGVRSCWSWVSEPAHRRHLLIVTVAILVCAYAAAVLGHVVLTPDLGIRCAFTTVVNQFDPVFLYKEDGAGLHRATPSCKSAHVPFGAGLTWSAPRSI